MVLTISYKYFFFWFLMIVPWDVPCQISHCWVHPFVNYPWNGQNMAPLWSKHGPQIVLKIGVPEYLSMCLGMFHAKFQIAGCILLPLFLEMAKIWPFMAKHGPHIVLHISSSWIFINLQWDALCQVSHSLLDPVASFQRNGQNMALYGQNIVLT